MVELKYIGKKDFIFRNTNLVQVETRFTPGQWIEMPNSDAKWMMKYNGGMFDGMRAPIPKAPPVFQKPKRYICPVCNKHYTSEKFYDMHMAKKHPEHGKETVDELTENNE